MVSAPTGNPGSATEVYFVIASLNLHGSISTGKLETLEKWENIFQSEKCQGNFEHTGIVTEFYANNFDKFRKFTQNTGQFLFTSFL